MKYIWTSIAIVAIWILSALILGARPKSNPEYVLSIAAVGTIMLALLGFKTPKI